MTVTLHHSSAIKPETPVLQRDHPLARGLLGCFDVQGGPRCVNLVDGATATPTGSFVTPATVTDMGLAGDFSTEADDGYAALGASRFQVQELTFAVWVVHTSEDRGRVGGLAVNGPYIRLQEGVSPRRIQIRNGNRDSTNLQTGFILEEDKTVHIAYSTNNAGVSGSNSVFLNGVNVANSSTTGTFSYSGGDTLTVGQNLTSGGHHLISFMMWDRKLSAEEILDLYVNPWDLITPPAEVIVTAAPPAGGADVGYLARHVRRQTDPLARM